MLSWQNALTCVPCQSCNPFRWTRVMRVTQTLGSRLPHCFLLVVSLIFPQCHLKISFCILPRVCSPHSAFCTQPAFYSQSAVCILHSVCILPLVCSLQFAVHSLPFTLTSIKVATVSKFLNHYVLTCRFLFYLYAPILQQQILYFPSILLINPGFWG